MSRYHLVALIAFATFSVSAKFYIPEEYRYPQEFLQELQRRIELLQKKDPAASADTESELTPDADEESNENNPHKIYESTPPKQYTEFDIRELIQRFGPYEK